MLTMTECQMHGFQRHFASEKSSPNKFSFLNLQNYSTPLADVVIFLRGIAHKPYQTMLYCDIGFAFILFKIFVLLRSFCVI
jgi:hypothetical protein